MHPIEVAVIRRGFFLETLLGQFEVTSFYLYYYIAVHTEGGISGVRAYHLTFIYLLLSILFF